MTTNKERATETIREAFETAMSSDTRSTWAYQIAQALADADLITPGMPEQEWPGSEKPVVKALHTVEDYEAAAIGTVVRRQELPWLAATFHKRVDGIWNSTGAHEYPSSEMAGTARTVLWEPKP